MTNVRPTAIALAFDRPATGFDPQFDGTALVRHGEWLGGVLEDAHLEQVDDFFSISASEITNLLGEHLPEGVDLDEDEEWFPTADGVSWVADVRRVLGDEADDPRTEEVLADLAAVERILGEAGQRRLRWHFVHRQPVA